MQESQSAACDSVASTSNVFTLDSADDDEKTVDWSFEHQVRNELQLLVITSNIYSPLPLTRAGLCVRRSNQLKSPVDSLNYSRSRLICCNEHCNAIDR